MKTDERLAKLEKTKKEIIRFTNELDEKLLKKEIDGMEYHLLLNKKLCGKNKQELLQYFDKEISREKNIKAKRKAITISAAAIILIIMALIGIIYTNPGVLTGYTTATREVQGTITYDRVFDHHTETQLDLEKITSIKISGALEGTRAIAKLRIDGVDYVIADITNNQQNQITGQVTEEPGYVLAADKTAYDPGETVTLTITPEAENYSLYINYGEETHKLDTNTYNPITPGEHQAITLIILPDDIIRLTTNFTVTEQLIENQNTTINETNTTTVEIPIQTNAYEFTDLCLETCNIEETSNPILIIEVEEGSKLTITNITTTATQENQAPTQTKTIPDITLEAEQTIELNLNQYFKDPEQDPIQYDINAIPEVTTTINQNYLTINSQNTGTYTAYIYATDGDKLTTSNTFQITIQDVRTTLTNESNQTTNETTPIIPINVSVSEADLCKEPDPNKRPVSCIEGNEEEYFLTESVFLKDDTRANAARITPLGNLLIKGSLFESSLAKPGADDFKVTMMNEYYEEIPIAWIDSITGDLHIKGRMYEEDFFLEPTPNAFVIQNKRNINLIYIDRNSGDLHLKGNLIQQKVKI